MKTRIWAVMQKEWLEAMTNKMILFTMSLLPLLILGISLGTLYGINSGVFGEESSGQRIPSQFVGMDPKDAMNLMMATEYLVLFLIVPVSIPVTIASYSIVGEKENKSLEPLLATPIRTWELLVAKSAAAVLPAIVIGWLVYGVFVLGAGMVARPVVVRLALEPMWVVANLAIGPLLALLSVLAGVIASSRMSDPRAVQQMVAFFVVPILVVGIGQMMGVLLLNVGTVLLGALLIALLDGAVLCVAVRLFQRETILTRWR